MLDKKLLDILCCPETKEDVALAEWDLVDRINAKIAAGGLRNRGGEEIKEKLDGGLVRADRKYIYPIRNDIPILLIDEAIPLAGLI